MNDNIRELKALRSAPFYDHSSQNNWNGDNLHDYWIDLSSELRKVEKTAGSSLLHLKQQILFTKPC